MKRIDRLIAGELLGPWAFGVAMFASLLLAATYLGRIADYVVQGLPVPVIIQITALMLPPILVKTFAMATLLGALLSFGRLSGDSEIVALRAGGASIYRIIWPAALFSLAVAGLTFVFNDYFVPNSVKQFEGLSSSIAKKIKMKSSQPTFQAIIEKDTIKAMIMAKDFNLGNRTLSGVTIQALDNEGNPTFYLVAKEMRYENSKEWRIVGPAKMFSADFRDITEVSGDIWPGQLPKLREPPEKIGVQQINNPDYFTIAELRQQLAKSDVDKSLTPEQYRNREYWLCNKFAMPLAAFVFGVLGAALGIRSHRAGTATGFALAVGIMFSYMTLANFMNVWAMGGVMSPAVASFTPIILGLGAALVIMWRRNTG